MSHAAKYCGAQSAMLALPHRMYRLCPKTTQQAPKKGKILTPFDVTFINDRLSTRSGCPATQWAHWFKLQPNYRTANACNQNAGCCSAWYSGDRHPPMIGVMDTLLGSPIQYLGTTLAQH